MKTMFPNSFKSCSSFRRRFYDDEASLKAPGTSISAQPISVVICLFWNYLLDFRVVGTHGYIGCVQLCD